MAKRFDHLFAEIASFENLYEAYRHAARGKRGNLEVAAFETNLERRLFDLQAALEDGSYKPGAYRSFFINDPKQRLISAAPFADRVVHHALVRVIGPLFERSFIGDSYANRVGRGTHAALDRAQGWARHYRYVLQCDVRQFFPSVDHALLLSVVERKIACAPTLDLCRRILAGGDGLLAGQYDMVHFSGDDLFAICRPRGLPIGNLTSQFWANVYLNELDQFVKRTLRCHAYLRYVDDFLLFSDDKAELWAWKSAVREKAASLRLTLHERSSTVYPVNNGIPFLGFRLFADRRRLKARNARAFTRRLAGWRRAYGRGELRLADIATRVRGWVAHACHGDTKALRRAIFRPPFVRRRSDKVSAAA